MRRALTFASRNQKEILRDPLSYLFCLAFPLIMLIVMTMVNASIPKEASVTVFRIEKLAPGIAVFGQTFLMLFACLSVAKDRSGSFLVRLYATPARSGDFIVGYLIPLLVLGIAQNAVLYAASYVVSLIVQTPLNPLGLLLSLLSLQLSTLLFISFGLLFGTLFSEKAAPGLCSIIISLGSLLGCIWFDAESLGGVMLKICKALPFFYCTKIGRSALVLDFGKETFWLPLLIVAACALVFNLAAVLAFRSRMRADLA